MFHLTLHKGYYTIRVGGWGEPAVQTPSKRRLPTSQVTEKATARLSRVFYRLIITLPQGNIGCQEKNEFLAKKYSKKILRYFIWKYRA
jgi:hypothetical protein